MNPTSIHSSNPILKVTLKALVFALAAFAAIFFASAGYGLLEMLFSGVSSDRSGGILELATHSGLTAVCFVLAAVCAVVAKKCIS